MPLPVLPAGIPFVSQQSEWRIAKLTQDPLGSEIEDGPDVMRRLSTGTWSDVEVALLMDNDAVTAWRTFYRDTLSHGARRFVAPAPAPWRQDGAPGSTMYIRRGTHSIRLRGPVRYIVSMTLSVLDY